MVYSMNASTSMVSRTSRSPIYLSALITSGATHVSASLSDADRFVLTQCKDSTALLIGEKCAMLVAEDLGYSGKALEMKVCASVLTICLSSLSIFNTL
jgi:hypothetical protein